MTVRNTSLKRWRVMANVFIRKLNGPKYRDGFALQFIEADLIDEKKNEKLEQRQPDQNGHRNGPGVQAGRLLCPVIASRR